MRSEHVAVRLATVAMLCAIFVPHAATLGRDYHLLLDALLHRLVDADAEVRPSVDQCAPEAATKRRPSLLALCRPLHF